MKFLLTLLLCLNVFAFDVKQIILNKQLTNTIYDTVDLAYASTDEMRRNYYYYENNDYEVVLLVDSRVVERSNHNYTVIFIRPVNSKLSDDNLITIRIERNGQIYLVGDMILNEEEILMKQDFINKLINECKTDMQAKKDKKDSRENSIKKRFMEKEWNY